MHAYSPYFLLIALIFFGMPLFAAAQGQQFVPLVPDFPQLPDDTRDISLPDLFNAFYAVAVGVAALLAVIMISIGGFKYMMSDSVFSKGDAKEQITEALIGLGIVLAAYLILQIINPDLTKLDVLTQERNPAAVMLFEPQATDAPREAGARTTFEGPACLPKGSETCMCPKTFGGGVLISEPGESPCRYLWDTK